MSSGAPATGWERGSNHLHQTARLFRPSETSPFVKIEAAILGGKFLPESRRGNRRSENQGDGMARTVRRWLARRVRDQIQLVLACWTCGGFLETLAKRRQILARIRPANSESEKYFLFAITNPTCRAWSLRWSPTALQVRRSNSFSCFLQPLTKGFEFLGFVHFIRWYFRENCATGAIFLITNYIFVYLSSEIPQIHLFM